MDATVGLITGRFGDRSPDVEPPATPPNITHADSSYILVPSEIDLSDRQQKNASPRLSRDVAFEGAAFIPEDDWPDEAEILSDLTAYNDALSLARRAREFTSPCRVCPV